MANFLFSSESVTEGHPDKICDQISDAVLDALLEQDLNCRVACETFAKTGFVLVGGEITADAVIDIPTIARNTLKEIGYTDNAMGIDYVSCGVLSAIDRQSPDIAQGVDRGDPAEQGAGDQGLMFGYASNETEELMPMPIQFAHRLAMRLAQVRKEEINGIDFLRPDGKTQVSIRYENDKPVEVEAIVVSTQHHPDASLKQIEEAVRELVIKPVIPEAFIGSKTNFHINPTGRFVVGGPQGDSGLTGRKIIVDTYGGMARHGGGAFSGKDPSKVDRSAAYYSRYMAKHVVAAGLAERCEVQLAYAIGVARPVSILVETFGTNTVPEKQIVEGVQRLFDARPGLLTQELDLRRPIFRRTAAYGHFGREDQGFSWEQTPRAEELRAACGASGPVPERRTSESARPQAKA
ncbi:methionine adenosyltransferase [Haliangium ochraceum]|uniref:S-adenosylmethionine synthase n=1 Tax=Haliangium ochraceum (strain DSM 14365 / JCM 11303 / SMP-2) TaxID=502025 RepID=D0LM62_HALO1|nr:methionine adenosyltransferase [Haliangium ochraceum]ACY16768.1 S-adenosylmethionine synthetase [Haliangium ochraceum DSM 14365]